MEECGEVSGPTCTAQTGDWRDNKSINCFFLFLDRAETRLCITGPPDITHQRRRRLLSSDIAIRILRQVYKKHQPDFLCPRRSFFALYESLFMLAIATKLLVLQLIFFLLNLTEGFFN